jgi:hypothetical protein
MRFSEVDRPTKHALSLNEDLAFLRFYNLEGKIEKGASNILDPGAKTPSPFFFSYNK